MGEVREREPTAGALLGFEETNHNVMEGSCGREMGAVSNY